MKVLIVCATVHEARALFELPDAVNEGFAEEVETGVTLIITGVGQVKTAWHLSRHLLQHQYDLAINAGICGTFKREIPLTTVVSITRDCFADLGAEDDEALLDIFDIGLEERNSFPFKDGWLYPFSFTDAFREIPTVAGITVNRASGSIRTIHRLSSKYNADVESLEGAAFFFACLMHNIPSIQLRAVSNYIEKRNRGAWMIQEALSCLGKVFRKEMNRLLII